MYSNYTNICLVPCSCPICTNYDVSAKIINNTTKRSTFRLRPYHVPNFDSIKNNFHLVYDRPAIFKKLYFDKNWSENHCIFIGDLDTIKLFNGTKFISIDCGNLGFIIDNVLDLAQKYILEDYLSSPLVTELENADSCPENMTSNLRTFMTNIIKDNNRKESENYLLAYKKIAIEMSSVSKPTIESLNKQGYFQKIANKLIN